MLWPLMLLTIVSTDATTKVAPSPNILIAISDDQSYPHTSAYGSKMVHTPSFDRVARAGVLFTRAFAPSPGCSPSRAALLTGRFPWQLESAGTHASDFPAKYATFPSQLEAAGYSIGFTGKGWGPGNWRISGRKQNPAGPEFNRRKLAVDSQANGAADDDYPENFADFLKGRPKGQPFCFWFGAHEPHRPFVSGAGVKSGKQLKIAEVPPFLPDCPEVRKDLLDYALEIESFDQQLGRMLDQLKELGELDNTIVIVTSDNGMSFPRAKANCYEFGIHVPLAIQWPTRVPGGRVVDDLASFVDLTATILEAAGITAVADATKSVAVPGRSLLPLLTSGGSGVLEPNRQFVYSARERHSSARFENAGYPQRAIRSRDYLYVRNFEPDRWPAGDPQELLRNGSLGPMHAAYYDIDRSPSLAFLVNHREDPATKMYFQGAVAKRPTEEFFDIRNDSACLTNLVNSPAHAGPFAEHRLALERFLKETGDPRVGPRGSVFETYPRFSPIRSFPKPK